MEESGVSGRGAWAGGRFLAPGGVSAPIWSGRNGINFLGCFSTFFDPGGEIFLSSGYDEAFIRKAKAFTTSL